MKRRGFFAGPTHTIWGPSSWFREATFTAHRHWNIPLKHVNHQTNKVAIVFWEFKFYFSRCVKDRTDPSMRCLFLGISDAADSLSVRFTKVRKYHCVESRAFGDAKTETTAALSPLNARIAHRPTTRAPLVWGALYAMGKHPGLHLIISGLTPLCNPPCAQLRSCALMRGV